MRYYLFLLLTGCASLTTQVDRVEVPVPITQSCVAGADIPTVPKTAATKDGNMVQDAAAASLDARVYKRTAETAVALLRICSEQP